MTEEELEKGIDEIVAKHDAFPTSFQFKKRAEDQLAKLLREDTKPEDIDAIKHILDSYPDFDSVMINIGNNKTLSINIFVEVNSIKDDPKAKKEFVKMIINMTK